MKSQRFIGKFDLLGPKIEISDPDLINQVFRVFRMRVGDSVVLCDGNGMEVDAVIESTGKKALFSLSNVRRGEKDKYERVLMCSILKKENFELVCQKATELGITRIIPVVSDRTIKLDINTERLFKIIKEATEQSGRLYMPAVDTPIQFKDAINIEGASRLFFNMDGEAVLATPAIAGDVVGMVGPEGGWTQEEILSAKNRGWKIVSLGKNTLRGETAAVIASYIIGRAS